jgi:hypothetical protein
VTYNVKHFPPDAPNPFRISVKHPAEFLIDLYHDGEVVIHELHEQGDARHTPTEETSSQQDATPAQPGAESHTEFLSFWGSCRGQRVLPLPSSPLGGSLPVIVARTALTEMLRKGLLGIQIRFPGFPISPSWRRILTHVAEASSQPHVGIR